MKNQFCTELSLRALNFGWLLEVGLLAPLAVSASMASADDLSLGVSRSQTLRFDQDIVKVNVDRPGVVDVSPSSDKRSLRVTGRRPGTTTVNVTKRSGETVSYDVQVDGAPGRDNLNEVLAELQALPGINAIKQGQRIVVTGVIATRPAGERFAAVSARARGAIIDNTEKPYRDTMTVADTINAILDKNAIQNLRARAYGKLITLQGFAKDPTERELALKIARLIDPNIEDAVEDAQFSAGPSVSVDVMFLESTAQGDLTMGLQGLIEDSSGAPRLAMARTQELSGELARGKVFWTVAPLQSMLTLLQRKGRSRVLSNPRIVVRSGNEAKFHSGGTVYLTQRFEKDEAAQLFPVQYGMVLNVRPKVDPLGQVDVVLSAEVSEFAASLQGNFPGTTLSKTDTAVTLKDGHSVLLTGFKNVKERKTITRVPFLADIPLVGELFKSRRFENEKRNLMVLMSVRNADVHEDQIRAFEALGRAPESSKQFTELGESSTDAVRFSVFD